jgi:putative membrane protein
MSLINGKDVIFMIKKEWQRLLHNPLLIVVLAAIILIPSIYAGFFLASMWDPYGELDKLPVAVVNKDVAVMYDGEEIAIGDELVKNLKEDASLNYSFVDDETAQQGLRNGDYYMVITIPEDFSYNATTVLDDNPEKMQLQYETDPATNYVAMKLSESAMTKIELSLERKVTETYAETLFEKLGTLGDSLDDASSGTSQILDGEIAMQDGVSALTDGTDELADGASDLNTGLVTYMDGTAAIDDGASALASGAGSLSDGAKKVNSGAVSLYDGTSKLATAAATITGGAQTLESGSAQLASGVDSLAAGSASVAEGASSVADGASALNDGLATLDSSMPVMTGAIGQLDDGASALNTGISTYTSSVDLAAASSGDLASGLGALDSAVNGTGGLKDSSALYKSNMDNLAATASSLAANGAISQDLADKIQAMDTAYASIDSAIAGQGGLCDSVTALSSGASQLNTGLNTIVGTDNANSKALRDGAAALSDGASQLDSSAATLASGVSQLASGASELKDGSAALAAGASQVSDGAAAAAAGAESVTAGASALNSGLGQFSNGVSDLNAGASTLASGTAALSQGASDLAAGAGELKDGTDELVSNNDAILTGSSELASGAGELDEGMNTLSDSIPELVDGTSTLYDGLSEGAAKLDDTNKNDVNAQMFASPLTTTETKLTEVSDNGHAMAAYMMSVGLWVACLAFCLMYPLTKHDGLESGFKWWLSKASVLYPMAVVQAVVLVLVLHFALGFEPARLGQTILVACLTSVAFMSIMYFFNVLLGKVGSFLMLIFMVLQLAGSAGTYPIEVSGPLAAALNKYMPFTYTVAAFRSSIGGGEPFPSAVKILLAIFICSSVLTVILFVIRGKRELAGKTNLYDVMEAHGFA